MILPYYVVVRHVPGTNSEIIMMILVILSVLLICFVVAPLIKEWSWSLSKKLYINTLKIDI